MPTAWFVCSYKRRTPSRVPFRYCEIDDFSSLITADGGNWSESEVLGNYAVAKVTASQATLDQIAAAPNIIRVPLRLVDSLSSLSVAQANALRNRLIAMGYTDAEITAALGNNLRQRTLADVLRFAASRRRKARYDEVADQIVLDGEVVTCKLIDDVDREVV